MKLGTEYIAVNDAEGRRLTNAAIPEWCDWPPPEELLVVHTGGTVVAMFPTSEEEAASTTAQFFEGEAGTFKRVTCSEISDDDAAGMTHVARGALYVPHDLEWDGRT